MKALKTILMLILLLVVLAVVAMLILPKNMDLTRSVEMDVSADQAWTHINSLKAQDAWSPWNEYDPNMERTFEGNDGEVGSMRKWTGNEDVGTGQQTVTAVDADARSMSSLLEFLEPWQSKADIVVNVEELEEGRSKVNWNFKQDMGMPMNLMMAMMSMKKHLTADFDRGLGYLKDQAEKAAADAKARPDTKGYEVKSEEREGRSYLVKKEIVKWSDMSEYFQTNMPAVFQAAAGAGLEINGAPCALFFTWDEENQQTEMSCAMPVAGGDAPEGYEVINTDAGTSLVVDYYGAYDGTENAHMGISNYMQANDLTMGGPVMEEYITDPGEEPDTAKWLTKIVYPIASADEATE